MSDVKWSAADEVWVTKMIAEEDSLSGNCGPNLAAYNTMKAERARCIEIVRTAFDNWPAEMTAEEFAETRIIRRIAAGRQEGEA